MGPEFWPNDIFYFNVVERALKIAFFYLTQYTFVIIPGTFIKKALLRLTG